MGFYPFVVGTDRYELNPPLFDKIRIKPTTGKSFTIKVEGWHSIEASIREIELNGQRIDDYQLEHAEIVRGGELIFKY